MVITYSPVVYALGTFQQLP